jgi:cysteine-rich repeat protein
MLYGVIGVDARRALAVLAAMSWVGGCGASAAPNSDASSTGEPGTTSSSTGTTGADTSTGAGASTEDGTGTASMSESAETTADASTGPPPPPPNCGDGVVDADEGCDDGNAADDDACPTNCVPASCGDGFVQAGVEGCDDGNAVDDDDCSNACVPASCGDGVVQAGEGCDDGDAVDDDECSNACQLPVCGDGLVQEGEACDDAGESAACDVDCSARKCGDGVVNATAGEACDDGGPTAACDDDCSLAECGDGQLSPLAGEACDDGNVSDDDLCSSTCQKTARIVFVSSELYTGNLGGLAGADAKCTALAQAAGLDGKFYAWLSAGATGPTTRFEQSTLPYVLPTGEQVASDWDDLVSGGPLSHAIDVTETGGPAPVPAQSCAPGKPTVWTNTLQSGAVWNASGCTAWTGIGDVARLGHAKATNLAWTKFCEGQAGTCGWKAALYCFEQP